jgi:hypothetical protein
MTYNLIEHENTNSMGFLKIHKNQNRNMLNHLCDYKDTDYFGTSIVWNDHTIYVGLFPLSFFSIYDKR